MKKILIASLIIIGTFDVNTTLAQTNNSSCPFKPSKDMLITYCSYPEGPTASGGHSVAFNTDSDTSRRLNAKLIDARNASMNWMQRWSFWLSNFNNINRTNSSAKAQLPRLIDETKQLQQITKEFVDDWNRQPEVYRKQFNLKKVEMYSVEPNPNDQLQHPNGITVWVDGKTNKVERVFDERSEKITEIVGDLYNAPSK
jgi:hypothetical protein